MPADRVESRPLQPRPLLRSPWFIWSWLLVVLFVVAQSLSYHWRVLPTSASGYFARGRTDYIEGKYDDAVGNLTQAIQRSPKDTESFIWRGEAYAKLEDYPKAKADLDQAVALRPDYPKSHAAMADYYVEVWDRDRAIDEFGKAIAGDPVYARCYLERGLLYQDAGRWNDAAADLRSASSLVIEDRLATAYLMLWMARARGGDVPGATEELGRIVATKRLDIRRFWAGAKFLGGDMSEPELIATMTKLGTGDEDELRAEAYFLAGGMHLATGDRPGGLARMRNVLRAGNEGLYAFERARSELTRGLIGFEPVVRVPGPGLEVAKVVPGSSAERAGIAAGALVVSIDGEPAERSAFLALLERVEPGMTVQLEIADAGGGRRAVALPVTLETSAPTR